MDKIIIQDLNNKLFCTFSKYENLESTINKITNRYSILYNKIFILESDLNDYICTYNLEVGNINDILEDTILTHRKKDTNTLYTINALNILIKQLNNGVMDKNYKINWENYSNCILLTQSNSLNKINTKIYKIVNL